MKYTGVVLIAGRPNLGKSTLFNKLIGKKISITSNKINTTIDFVDYIVVTEQFCVQYLDSPGIDYHPYVAEVDVIVLVLEHGKWTKTEENICTAFPDARVIAVVNKMDRIKDERSPASIGYKAWLRQQHDFLDVCFVSSKQGHGVDQLRKTIISCLNLSQASLCVHSGSLTRDIFWQVKEIIREKIFRCLHSEVPYAINVKVERLGEKFLLGSIFVKNNSHKKIVIGAQGRCVQHIQEQVNQDLKRLETHFTKVFLKVKLL